MKYMPCAFLGLSLILSGCDRPEQIKMPVSGGGAGPIEAINHTSWAINHFSVDGQNAVDIIGPYQGGGGGGSYGAPAVWTPDLKVKVEWETGVAFASDVPEIPEPDEPDTKNMDENARYHAWQEYSDQKEEWYSRIKAFSKRHSRLVSVPDYTGQKTCGITVHFLPCDQIKVTTSCADYGSPDYPIKDPVHMEKPSVCPQ
ncbi:DUF3304 domain-containing protein [Enterobacter sp. CC120223-11]|uniref:DUF3304 domain-containing protein n=1 Tax=Enterobacter sp. CC120223-11 TaxID=1378073 RepID=UPI000BDA521E|nr:DUF3304 domain-containing protein [Enterobacter sp. CC120223-11]SNY59046.1 Protein of unknown function [Enterobacter sp. CC120223-11]